MCKKILAVSLTFLMTFQLFGILSLDFSAVIQTDISEQEAIPDPVMGIQEEEETPDPIDYGYKIETTPRPEFETFSLIPQSVIDLSNEAYCTLLDCDPYMFLWTDEGIKRTDKSKKLTDSEFEFVKNKAIEITSGCSSAYDKIYAIAEYMAKNICYDYDYYPDEIRKPSEYLCSSAYDVLTSDSAVCHGFAITCETLLQSLGIPCVYVLSPGHAWNMAYDGTRWILFDTTWMAGGRLEHNELKKSDYVGWDWFDFTIDQANSQENHTISELPIMIVDGEMTNFPEYTTTKNIVIPSTVKRISCTVIPDGCHIKTLTLPNSVAEISNDSFKGSIGKIYYQGSESEYRRISIAEKNVGLTGCFAVITNNATVSYKTNAEYFTAFIGESIELNIDFPHIYDQVSYKWYVNSSKTNVGGKLINNNSSTYSFIPNAEGEYYYYLEITIVDSSDFLNPVVTVKTEPITVIVVNSANYKCGNNITWSFSNGVLILDGSGAMFDYGWDNAPWEKYKDAIEEIVISDNITYIGQCGFDRLPKLKKVSLPNTLSSVGAYAFYNCNGLTSVIIPDNTSSIGAKAFAYCSGLTQVFFNGNNSNIWVNDTFLSFDGYELPKFYIEEGLATWTFPYWTDKFGNEFKTSEYDPEIYGSTFACGPQSTWAIGDNTLYVYGKGDMFDFAWDGAPWEKYQDDIKEIVISDDITYIGKSTFDRFPYIEKISLPKNLVSIGESAFYNCGTIKTVIIPNNVTGIGKQAFAYCTPLRKIFFTGDVPVLWGENVFINFESQAPALFYVPDLYSAWTTPYWTDPFGNVFETVRYNSVIYQSGYSCGTNLSWAVDNDTLYIYGEGEMFDYDLNAAPWNGYKDSIKTVVIHDGVTHIGQHSFSQLRNVETVYISKRAATIGDFAFYNFALKSVYFYGDVPEVVWKRSFEESSFSDLVIYYNETIQSNWTTPEWISYDDSVYTTQAFNAEPSGLCEHLQLEAYPETSPTCSTRGHSTYFICKTCRAVLKSDLKTETTVEAETFGDYGHTGGTATCTSAAICVLCNNPYGELLSHEFDLSQWNKGDLNGHWHKCLNCDAHDEPIPHTPGPEATEEAPQVCTVCGYVIKDIRFILGDVTGDGQINLDDVVKLLRHVSKADIITDSKLLAAGEIVEDGVLNLDDVVRLLRYVSKAIPSLR